MHFLSALMLAGLFSIVPFSVGAADSTHTLTVDLFEPSLTDDYYKNIAIETKIGDSAAEGGSHSVQAGAQIIDAGLHGTEYTYSVKDYADYLLDHADEREDLAAAVPLVKKMLNYGAYAQLYFNKNPETLANAKLDDAEKLLGDVTITAPDTVFDLPDGVTYEGATLSLKSETTLSLYFKSNKTLAFSVDGKTVETVKSGSYQIARIRGIPAKELKDSFALSVTSGESGGSVTYSPMNYCYIMLNDDTEDVNLINVIKALYLYAQAADSYFD